jgi:EAL domain-containing protein (putative c-di-GMP-specific phosphodiesterase class I)
VSAERANASIVAAIISLAHSLGLDVVAEGVETAAQLEYLDNLGCDCVQGYYIARPEPAESVEKLLRAMEKSRPPAVGEICIAHL